MGVIEQRTNRQTETAVIICRTDKNINEIMQRNVSTRAALFFCTFLGTI